MAWIGKSQGIFKLHDSDNYCGSYISISDLAEILCIDQNNLKMLPTKQIDGATVISELIIHKEWGAGRILSQHKPRCGTAIRSFDEIIVMKLLELNLPECKVDHQVQFGRKFVDLKVTCEDTSIFIEFVGPSHFIPQYQREPVSPSARKREVEDHFDIECVIWPFWIQRCSRNIKALFSSDRDGFASVWSTKAFFGDFVYPKSADIIIDITARFGAIKSDGIGYMYGDTHTNKSRHPIIEKTLKNEESKNRLIPKGNSKPDEFWLPKELWDASLTTRWS
jgi:hypothetical protein